MTREELLERLLAGEDMRYYKLDVDGQPVRKTPEETAESEAPNPELPCAWF